MKLSGGERRRIVEDGTHAELLARDGIYAALWKRQVGGFLIDRPPLERETFDG